MHLSEEIWLSKPFSCSLPTPSIKLMSGFKKKGCQGEQRVPSPHSLRRELSWSLHCCLGAMQGYPLCLHQFWWGGSYRGAVLVFSPPPASYPSPELMVANSFSVLTIKDKVWLLLITPICPREVSLHITEFGFSHELSGALMVGSERNSAEGLPATK